eukprot:scaffold350982_cov20-Prasinocladus_malaysianus.AAC.1
MSVISCHCMVVRVRVRFELQRIREFADTETIVFSARVGERSLWAVSTNLAVLARRDSRYSSDKIVVAISLLGNLDCLIFEQVEAHIFVVHERNSSL